MRFPLATSMVGVKTGTFTVASLGIVGSGSVTISAPIDIYAWVGSSSGAAFPPSGAPVFAGQYRTWDVKSGDQVRLRSMSVSSGVAYAEWYPN